MTSSTTQDFARRVVAAVPDLEPVLAEHLEDNVDELLPHVFFGDVTRWAEQQASTSPGSPALERLLGELTAGFASGDEEVRDLITVSFLENLDDDSPVIERLSPALRDRRAQLYE